MNYFKGEFLEEKDFTDEQQYHRDMLRLHNKDLHTWGIADGLVVDFTAGEKKITVHEGMAVDADGTHIVLDTRKDIDLTGAPTATALYLTISYNETPGDQRTDTGITGFARIVEEPKIQYSNSQPSDPSRQLILSTVTLNSDQTIQKVDPSLRKRAGVVAGDLEVTSTAFVLPIAKTNWPKIKGIGTGGIEIDATAIQANSPTTSFSGALTVGGNVGIGTTSPQQNLSVNRAMNIDQANANNGTVNSALTFGSGSGEAIASKRTAGGNQFGLDFYTNSNNRMSITNGGNVGIGTTTPTEKLEIAGNLKIAAHGTFIDFGSDTRQMIDLWGGGAYGIGIQSWTHYFRSAGNFAWYVGGSHSDTELDPGVSGTAALIIKRGSGNIGIGTTNPENADSWNKVLDVLGSGNAKLSVRTAGIDARILAHDSGWWNAPAGMIIGTKTAHPLSFGTSSVSRMTIDGSGNVGIGTPGPSNKLHVTVGDLEGIRVSGSDANLGIGLLKGTGDGATSTTYNGALDSWYGIAFRCKLDGIVRHTFNTRDGSAKIAGKLGTNGYDPNSGYPAGWGGGIHTWDIAAHGTGKSVSGWQTGSWDLAEKFEKYDESLEPGDVVVADTSSSEKLIKSTDPYQDNLLGVISEKPGFLLGVNWEDPQYPIALALAGRVKVKVNMEGGHIREGDYLTSSSEESYAMKANRSGRVIGIALDSFDGRQGSKGKVVVFVNPHWWGGYNRRNT